MLLLLVLFVVDASGRVLIRENSLNFTEGFLAHPRRKELADPFLNLHYCQKQAKCYRLNQTTCMGVRLPYNSSTLDLTRMTSEEQMQEVLHLYQYLRYVPKCWAVIQPFLCALYMPRCEDDKVYLPSKEMCRITMGPCKIFHETGIFPEFMKCEDEELFPSHCKNDIHELKFNTTGYCMEPLVKTEQDYWFYPGERRFNMRSSDCIKC